MPLRSPKRDLSFVYPDKFLLQVWSVMKGAVLISICRNNDFRRIYSKGKSIVTPVVVIYVLKKKTDCSRIGITTSKKIGNAVQRNRSRRIIKEAVREIYPDIKKGYDLVFVARGKTPYVKSTDISKQIKKELSKAGILGVKYAGCSG